MAMVLLLTTDGEAIIVKVWKSNGDGSASHHRWRSHIVKAVACSAIHRQCKTSGPTMCRTTRTTSKWKSNHTRKRKRMHIYLMRSSPSRWNAGQRIDDGHEQTIATEATFWRTYLLRIINIGMTLDMMSLAGIARAPRIRGQFNSIQKKLSRARGDTSAVPSFLQDLRQTPARTAKYLNTTT